MAQPDSDEKQNDNTNKVYNWGILGCGKISNDFANCLDKHPRAKIVACAARSKASAQNFAKTFEIGTYYGSYDELARDKNVDVVYVGTIHPAHYKLTLSCLNNGKHVVCEKPMGMNSKEVGEMIDCAVKNKRFLLEGMWTRFFPVVRRVRSLIFEENAIGDVVSFSGSFGVAMPSIEEAPRLWDIKLGGGGILDLGCYVVAPLSLVFGTQYPKEIKAMGTIVNGIDTMMSASLKYSDTQFANIGCNFYCNTPEVHDITGTKGRIRIESPSHAPTSFEITRFGNSDEKRDDVGKRDVISKTREEFALPKGFRTDFVFSNSEGFYYEVDAVTKCLDKGLIQSPDFTHKEILITNQIMDELRKQIGVKYPQDK